MSSDFYRTKYVSLIIQPKTDEKFWLKDLTTEEYENQLMSVAFPLFTEIENSLRNLSVLTVNNKTQQQAEKFVFGTETSKETKIPHYISLNYKSNNNR